MASARERLAQHYLRAAADYLQRPLTASEVRWAAYQAAVLADLAAFTYLQQLRHQQDPQERSVNP